MNQMIPADRSRYKSIRYQKSEFGRIPIASDRAQSGLEFSRLNLVHITPHPGFPWLDGPNQWVLGFVEVFGGVLVLRRIATTHMFADQAHPQVDPGVAHFHAFFTDASRRVPKLDFVKMAAFFRHESLWRRVLKFQ
jgi:hypothetical protein